MSTTTNKKRNPRTTRPQNPKDSGSTCLDQKRGLKEKFYPGSGEEKPRYDLISPIGMDLLARVCTYGARKYLPRNWEKGIPFSEMFSALQRHAWAWKLGSDIDQESGQHHMACVAFWAFAILHISVTKPEFDDRLEI